MSDERNETSSLCRSRQCHALNPSIASPSSATVASHHEPHRIRAVHLPPQRTVDVRLQLPSPVRASGMSGLQNWRMAMVLKEE
jgi:hypothetical protein